MRTRVNALAITKDGKSYTIKSNEVPLQAEDCVCTHAEMRVIHDLEGQEIHTVLVTHSPCEDCAKMLVQVGVKVVGYFKRSKSDAGIQILLDGGVTLIDMSDFLEEVEL